MYWNESEALVLLANLSDAKVSFRWKLDTNRIGWAQGEGTEGKEGNARSGTLDPLSYRYVRIPRAQ